MGRKPLSLEWVAVLAALMLAALVKFQVISHVPW